MIPRRSTNFLNLRLSSTRFLIKKIVHVINIAESMLDMLWISVTFVMYTDEPRDLPKNHKICQ